MSDYKSLLTMGGVSLVVSTLVVLANNIYLYKHACKKPNSVPPQNSNSE